MLASGADVEDEGWRTTKAFEKAIAVRNLRVIKVLLRFEPTIAPWSLVEAVRSNNVQIVKLLLQRVDSAAVSGLLHESIYSPNRRCRSSWPSNVQGLSSRETIIGLILEKGAHVDARDPWRNLTALELAINMDDLEAVDILLRFKPKIEAMMLESVLYSKPHGAEMMRLLVDHCARFSEGEELRSTALKVAALYGNLDSLRNLIQSGVKVDVELSHAVRTRWLGTDSRARQAVLQMLNNHEITRVHVPLFRPVRRAASVSTELTALLASQAVDNENETFGSFLRTQFGGCLACFLFIRWPR
jgi:ankyrin repeat protein